MTGTFIKLQEAFASERTNVGSWSDIGYKGPGQQHGASSSETGSFLYDDQNANGKWMAYAKVTLNDCESGTWGIETEFTSGNLVSTATTSDEGKCVTPLMPNYCKLATSGSCGSSSTTPSTEP